jgi:hypothetical protein
MAGLKKQNLERFHYWQGQKLQSSDFRRIAEDDAQRRWWHNRALHNAWGIYRGYETTPFPTNQPKFILAGPGLAYDYFGRELLLENPQQVPVPTNIPIDRSTSEQSDMNLLVRYKELPGSCASRDSSGACWPQSGSQQPGTVEFVWKPTNATRQSDAVLLGVLRNGGGKKTRFEATFARVKTRPLARPLLASAATIPGNTPWQAWTPNPSDDSSVLIGVQTNIDTSSAGFTAVPCYFAWLEGSLWSLSAQQFLPAFFPSLANESTSSFTFRLLIPFIRQFRQSAAAPPTPPVRMVNDLDEFLAFAQRQKLYVAWVGCQMPPQVPFVSFRQGISNISLIKEIVGRFQIR